MDLAISARAGRLWRAAVDTVTPPHCLACHAPVSEPAALCIACWQKLHLIDEPVCTVLGTPFSYAAGAGAVSQAARDAPPVWDRARGAVAYDDASRPLIHALKYRDTQEAGLLMARMMARAGRQLLAEAEVIVPVPLYRWRLWRRRFNQSAYLAQELSRAAVRPWRSDLLIRIKPTRPQVGLKDDERRANVRRAFAAEAGVAGRRVLLIDDVLTTGATAGACAAALKAAGAAQVDVLCFALVLKPHALHI